METYTANQLIEAYIARKLYQSILHRQRAHEMSLYPAQYSKAQIRAQFVHARELAMSAYRLAWRLHGSDDFLATMPTNDEEENHEEL